MKCYLVCIFAIGTALSAFGQDPYTLVASDGNLYGSDYTGLYRYSPATEQVTVLNTSAVNLQLCLERPDATFLALTAYATSPAQLLTVSMGGQVTPIASFPAGGGQTCPAIASDGNYYGGAAKGGQYGKGYFYQLTSAGVLTDFYDFTGQADGSGPVFPPVEASDGNLYYFASSGLLRYSATSGLTEHSPAHANLQGGPIEASDGNFYALENDGIVQIQPDGMSTLVYGLSADYYGNYPYPSGLYLTGSASFPLAFWQSYYYTISGEPGGCPSLTGDYLTLISTSLTGASTQTLDTIGGDASNSGYAYSYGVSLLPVGDGSFAGLLDEYSAGYTFDDSRPDTYSCTPTGSSTIQPTISPAGAAFLPMTISKAHVRPDQTATVTWQALNAFSNTAKQCYGYGLLSGLLPASGSATVKPSSSGTYTAAIVCGGTATNFVTISAGAPTLEISSNLQAVYGSEPVQFSAVLTGSNIGTPPVTGTISLLDGSTVIGSATLLAFSNSATIDVNTAGIAPGTYSVVGSYSGDENYLPAKSKPLAITIEGRMSVTTQLSPASQSVDQGSDAMLTATITAPAGYGGPTGTVKFTAASQLLATVPLANAVDGVSAAVVTHSTAGIAPGTYVVTASYSGDLYYLPSSANATVTLTDVAGTSVALAATPDPVPTGQSLSLTAEVTGKDDPSGTIIFSAGSAELASASLQGGVAKVTLAPGTLAPGTYSITAYYAGDANNQHATSAPASLTVD